MDEPDRQDDTEQRMCSLCRGTAIFWRTAIIPGDAHAPRSSNRALAHAQPAWVCLECGHLEPHERRTREAQHVDQQIWRP
jgi:hypothetical protein